MNSAWKIRSQDIFNDKIVGKRGGVKSLIAPIKNVDKRYLATITRYLLFILSCSQSVVTDTLNTRFERCTPIQIASSVLYT